MAENEMAENEMAENEMAENEMAENEMAENEMYEIAFNRYINENDRDSYIFIERPKEIFDKALKSIKNGYHFEVRVLSSVRVELSVWALDMCIEKVIAKNKPNAVSEAVDHLINKFYDEYVYVDVVNICDFYTKDGW